MSLNTIVMNNSTISSYYATDFSSYWESSTTPERPLPAVSRSAPDRFSAPNESIVAQQQTGGIVPGCFRHGEKFVRTVRVMESVVVQMNEIASRLRVVTKDLKASVTRTNQLADRVKQKLLEIKRWNAIGKLSEAAQAQEQLEILRSSISAERRQSIELAQEQAVGKASLRSMRSTIEQLDLRAQPSINYIHTNASMCQVHGLDMNMMQQHDRLRVNNREQANRLSPKP